MNGNRGVALILVIMAMSLLAALGLSLSILANTEMRVAANYSHSQEAVSAAETALELAVRELLALPDWSPVLSGAARSTINDGPPAGLRSLPDGTPVSLSALTAELGNPSWRLFAHGSQGLWGLPIPAYVAVWVRPDPRDAGVIVVRADAFGVNGARRAVQASVTRSRVLSWSHLR